MNKVHFSSKTDEWSTPQDRFNEWHREFGFTLDVCATAENAKLPRYFTRADDGLSKLWTGERVWMNSPYGRGIVEWYGHASANVLFHGCPLVVGLAPARTDTRWWHTYVIPYAAEIRFLRGRLKFGGAKHSAPFPSALVVYRRRDIEPS